MAQGYGGTGRYGYTYKKLGGNEAHSQSFARKSIEHGAEAQPVDEGKRGTGE